MIKINLVREGRAVRGAGAAPAASGGGSTGGSKLNNILVIALLVIGLSVAAGYWLWQKNELANRKEVLAQREAEATKLEAIIKEVDEYQKRKDSLQQRIDLINQLKLNQKGPVRIMDQISRDLPDLVWIDQMSITGQQITLTGRGLNANAIANFVENVKRDPYFEEPQVGGITQASVDPLVYTFDMNFNFTYVPKGAEGAAAAATTTTGTTGTTGTSAGQ